MRSKTLLIILTLTFAACAEPGGLGAPEDPNAPILQVRSEGGFMPVEWALGTGPRYTLLADDRLIYSGPVIMIFPGPLLPNYQVAQATDEQMRRVLRLVEEIGLPQIDHEVDDSAMNFVADAGTEMVTYWDDAGEHTYGVYALGLETDGPQSAANSALQELIEVLGEVSAGTSLGEYEGERVRVVAGVVGATRETPDVREWPLGETDLSEWQTLQNGWRCKVYGTEILDQFRDATEQTAWTHPDEELPFKLLVRPLHPGEPDCPAS
ncbi:MAG: hypothetical protein KY394_04985 [Actinobacteria bacterium]|nr:hypothetical protein [Actinomycetota bacterium]